MKTTYGYLVLLIGFVVGPALPVAAISSDVADQKFAIIRTCEPSVRSLIGEALPAFGQVRLVVSVDETGKLVDWMLLDYAHVRYADAAVDALRKWQFRPAIVGGVPVGVRTEIVFDFETRGQVVSLACVDTMAVLMKRLAGDQQIRLLCRAGELDATPKPIVMVSPLPVQQVGGEAPPRGVLVDFYIDETGRPRMATVASDRGNELMASAALEAIGQWRFTPPTSKGRLVAVRASQWFDFSKTAVAEK